MRRMRAGVPCFAPVGGSTGHKWFACRQGQRMVFMLAFFSRFVKGIQSGYSDRARTERFALFSRELQPTPGKRVLDVGAGQDFFEWFPFKDRLLVLNLLEWQGRRTWNGREVPHVIVGNGCRLPFKDQALDIVYSNATLEHVGKENWQAFADEVRRVGKSYWVSTPNKWFPLDVHYHLPFFHFLPKGMQRWCAKAFGLDAHRSEVFLDTDLLTAEDLRRLFPDAKLVAQGAVIPFNWSAYKKP